ncbi:MAG TPA: crossover junction endodeoxyribonuclease RuvC [Ktedonobacterales bacterium]
MPAEPRRALGIDPGTARLGYAVVEQRGSALSLLTAGVLATKAARPMPTRLRELHDGLLGIIREQAPTEMAVEELFFAKNVNTAIAVGQARGIALLAAAMADLAVYEYKPMQVKQAVHGYGLATKAQVGEMVRVLLNLAAVPTPDDAADAAAIAICHLNSIQLSGVL